MASEFSSDTDVWMYGLQMTKLKLMPKYHIFEESNFCGFHRKLTSRKN